MQEILSKYLNKKGLVEKITRKDEMDFKKENDIERSEKLSFLSKKWSRVNCPNFCTINNSFEHAFWYY